MGQTLPCTRLPEIETVTASSDASQHPLTGQAETVSYKVYVCDWHVIFIRGLAGRFGGLAGCLHLYRSCGCYNGTG